MISKIKPFIDQYNWKEIDFPSHGKGWKKFESNNKPIALSILYVLHNTEKIRHAYKSKYNLTRQTQVIILMITDGEKWHYLAVKRLSALLREITGNNHGDFYCLNCFQSCTTENKLKKHKKFCENYDYCYVEMPEEYDKILNYNEGEKSVKSPFIVYADLECLLEKTNTCHNNPEKLSTTKINNDTPSTREHVTKVINYEKKEIIPLTKKEEKKHNKQKVCHICEKRFSTNDNNKKYHKVRDSCHYTGKYRGAPHDIWNLRYKIPKQIPLVFHNGSFYDYHFITKKLAEEYEEEFECLGGNTEKYITFSVPIKKQTTKKDKNGNDKITKISYIRSYHKFIYSYSFQHRYQILLVIYLKGFIVIGV